MTPEKSDQLKRFLIQSTVGPSAVRNQGKGIINPIRDKLDDVFKFKVFFEKLFAKSDKSFQTYLDYLTNEVAGLQGIDENNELIDTYVRWGTARKCTNLVLRSVVYSGHIWEE